MRRDERMTPGGLAARLNRIKGQPAQTAAPPGRQPRPVEIPAGWEEVSEFVWRRRLSVDAVSPLKFLPSPLLPGGVNVEDLVFFDTETTGLSGGAGTYVFLAGFGSVSSGKLHIEQYFLRDYPGEREFLDLIQESVDDRKILVSYNGKAFDSQILKTRFVMNGRSLRMGGQLDLLYPARRLWQNSIPSCSLGCIEEYVLNIRREIDIPGAMVPDIYFAFLKLGEVSDLERVFAHHFQDIVSLERLLTRITEIVTGGKIDTAVDRCRLGRWMIDTGFQKGISILSEAFASGDGTAGYHLGRYLKRAGAYEEAAMVWTEMFNRDNDMRAAFELAKYAEHKQRDFKSAETYANAILLAVEKGGNLPTLEPVDRLEHRIRRIQRKAHR